MLGRRYSEETGDERALHPTSSYSASPNLLVVPFIDCPAGIDCALSKTSMVPPKGWEGFEGL